MKAVVDGYFLVLHEDLTAARRLIDCVPRSCAFHLQQAAEKLVKAILSAEGVHAAADHNIGQLIARLPDGNEWKGDLVDLDYLSQFATTYRDPSERGRIAPPPDKATLEKYIALIDILAEEAKDWCER